MGAPERQAALVIISAIGLIEGPVLIREWKACCRGGLPHKAGTAVERNDSLAAHEVRYPSLYVGVSARPIRHSCTADASHTTRVH